MAAANGLIDAAEATRNPYALSFALLAYGFAFRDADPDRALEAHAPGSGDRSRQRQPHQRDPPGGQSGPTRSQIRRPAGRARILRCGHPQPPRLGQHREYACLAGCARRSFSTGSDATNRRRPSPGFASNPITAVAVPEIGTAITHLRDVLGDQTYESLARKGETMTTAAMVTYAYDQIDQARAELNAVSK